MFFLSLYVLVLALIFGFPYSVFYCVSCFILNQFLPCICFVVVLFCFASCSRFTPDLPLLIASHPCRYHTSILCSGLGGTIVLVLVLDTVLLFVLSCFLVCGFLFCGSSSAERLWFYSIKVYFLSQLWVCIWVLLYNAHLRHIWEFPTILCFPLKIKIYPSRENQCLQCP